jgi:site-specific DNA-methyltransferase (adenine-specific)
MQQANTPPSNVPAKNNHLYFGDNLNILREHIRDESVDLIYLDPPFNSHANYNVLFKSPKGADGGIDGLIYFNEGDKLPKKIIVSVKGGENVSRTMVADLKNAVEREKAQLGLFVTLTPPTAPMKTEASAAGFYESPLGLSFPKIQILTVSGLLAGNEQARFPDFSRGGLTFKQAQREEKPVDQTKLF